MYEASDSTEGSPTYSKGDIVWVKLSSYWWPGEVINEEDLPEDLLSDFKKPPLAIVKFFDEDSYEYVKNWSNIYPYNCNKKNEFIKKGMAGFRSKLSHMAKFPKDIGTAEERTNGNPNILSQPEFLPVKKINYDEIFGTPSPKKSTKGKVSLPSNKKAPARDNNQPHITHRRFLGNDDYRAYICIQYPGKDRTWDSDDEDIKKLNEEPEKLLTCQSCSFSTKRLEVMILHTKMHIQGIYITAKRKTKKSTKGADVSDSESDTTVAKSPKPKQRKKKEVKAKPTDVFTDLLEEWDDTDEEMEETKKKLSKAKKKAVQVEKVLSDNEKDEIQDEKDESDNKSKTEKTSDSSETKDIVKPQSPLKNTQDDIKNCFDFDEEEEDDDFLLPTSVGRKIPRVIPEKPKPSISELLEQSQKEDELEKEKISDSVGDAEKPLESAISTENGADVNRKEILRLSQSFNRASDVDENIAITFKELMAETELPALDDLTQNLKAEQNFHDARAIKFPDKGGTATLKGGTTSKGGTSRKRFVTSFEDFEAGFRKIEDEDRIRKLGSDKEVKTAKTPNATQNLPDNSEGQTSVKPTNKTGESKENEELVKVLDETAKIVETPAETSESHSSKQSQASKHNEAVEETVLKESVEPQTQIAGVISIQTVEQINASESDTVSSVDRRKTRQSDQDKSKENDLNQHAHLNKQDLISRQVASDSKRTSSRRRTKQFVIEEDSEEIIEITKDCDSDNVLDSTDEIVEQLDEEALEKLAAMDLEIEALKKSIESTESMLEEDGMSQDKSNEIIPNRSEKLTHSLSQEIVNVDKSNVVEGEICNLRKDIVETDPRTEAKTETRTEVETEPTTDVETEPRTEVEIEPRTKDETEPRAESVQDCQQPDVQESEQSEHLAIQKKFQGIRHSSSNENMLKQDEKKDHSLSEMEMHSKSKKKVSQAKHLKEELPSLSVQDLTGKSSFEISYVDIEHVGKSSVIEEPQEPTYKGRRGRSRGLHKDTEIDKHEKEVLKSSQLNLDKAELKLLEVPDETASSTVSDSITKLDESTLKEVAPSADSKSVESIDVQQELKTRTEIKVIEPKHAEQLEESHTYESVAPEFTPRSKWGRKHTKARQLDEITSEKIQPIVAITDVATPKCATESTENQTTVPEPAPSSFVLEIEPPNPKTRRGRSQNCSKEEVLAIVEEKIDLIPNNTIVAEPRQAEDTTTNVVASDIVELPMDTIVEVNEDTTPKGRMGRLQKLSKQKEDTSALEEQSSKNLELEPKAIIAVPDVSGPVAEIHEDSTHKPRRSRAQKDTKEQEELALQESDISSMKKKLAAKLSVSETVKELTKTKNIVVEPNISDSVDVPQNDSLKQRNCKTERNTVEEEQPAADVQDSIIENITLQSEQLKAPAADMMASEVGECSNTLIEMIPATPDVEILVTSPRNSKSRKHTTEEKQLSDIVEEQIGENFTSEIQSKENMSDVVSFNTVLQHSDSQNTIFETPCSQPSVEKTKELSPITRRNHRKLSDSQNTVSETPFSQPSVEKTEKLSPTTRRSRNRNLSQEEINDEVFESDKGEAEMNFPATKTVKKSEKIHKPEPTVCDSVVEILDEHNIAVRRGRSRKYNKEEEIVEPEPKQSKETAANYTVFESDKGEAETNLPAMETVEHSEKSPEPTASDSVAEISDEHNTTIRRGRSRKHNKEEMVTPEAKQTVANYTVLESDNWEVVTNFSATETIEHPEIGPKPEPTVPDFVAEISDEHNTTVRIGRSRKHNKEEEMVEPAPKQAKETVADYTVLESDKGEAETNFPATKPVEQPEKGPKPEPTVPDSVAEISDEHNTTVRRGRSRKHNKEEEMVEPEPKQAKETVADYTVLESDKGEAETNFPATKPVEQPEKSPKPESTVPDSVAEISDEHNTTVRRGRSRKHNKEEEMVEPEPKQAKETVADYTVLESDKGEAETNFPATKPVEQPEKSPKPEPTVPDSVAEISDEHNTTVRRGRSRKHNKEEEMVEPEPKQAKETVADYTVLESDKGEAETNFPATKPVEQPEKSPKPKQNLSDFVAEISDEYNTTVKRGRSRKHNKEEEMMEPKLKQTKETTANYTLCESGKGEAETNVPATKTVEQSEKSPKPEPTVPDSVAEISDEHNISVRRGRSRKHDKEEEWVELQSKQAKETATNYTVVESDKGEAETNFPATKTVEQSEKIPEPKPTVSDYVAEISDAHNTTVKRGRSRKHNKEGKMVEPEPKQAKETAVSYTVFESDKGEAETNFPVTETLAQSEKSPKSEPTVSDSVAEISDEHNTTVRRGRSRKYNKEEEMELPEPKQSKEIATDYTVSESIDQSTKSQNAVLETIDSDYVKEIIDHHTPKARKFRIRKHVKEDDVSTSTEKRAAILVETDKRQMTKNKELSATVEKLAKHQNISLEQVSSNYFCAMPEEVFSKTRRGRSRKQTQEEEDFARAIEESLKDMAKMRNQSEADVKEETDVQVSKTEISVLSDTVSVPDELSPRSRKGKSRKHSTSKKRASTIVNETSNDVVLEVNYTEATDNLVLSNTTVELNEGENVTPKAKRRRSRVHTSDQASTTLDENSFKDIIFNQAEKAIDLAVPETEGQKQEICEQPTSSAKRGRPRKHLKNEDQALIAEAFQHTEHVEQKTEDIQVGSRVTTDQTTVLEPTISNSALEISEQTTPRKRGRPRKHTQEAEHISDAKEETSKVTDQKQAEELTAALEFTKTVLELVESQQTASQLVLPEPLIAIPTKYISAEMEGSPKHIQEQTVPQKSIPETNQTEVKAATMVVQKYSEHKDVPETESNVEIFGEPSFKTSRGRSRKHIEHTEVVPTPVNENVYKVDISDIKQSGEFLEHSGISQAADLKLDVVSIETSDNAASKTKKHRLLRHSAENKPSCSYVEDSSTGGSLVPEVLEESAVMDSSVLESAISDSTTVTEEPIPKAKRGRPRKHVPEENTDSTSKEPRNVELEPILTDIATEAATQAEECKNTLLEPNLSEHIENSDESTPMARRNRTIKHINEAEPLASEESTAKNLISVPEETTVEFAATGTEKLTELQSVSSEEPTSSIKKDKADIGSVRSITQETIERLEGQEASEGHKKFETPLEKIANISNQDHEVPKLTQSEVYGDGSVAMQVFSDYRADEGHEASGINQGIGEQTETPKTNQSEVNILASCENDQKLMDTTKINQPMVKIPEEPVTKKKRRRSKHGLREETIPSLETSQKKPADQIIEPAFGNIVESQSATVLDANKLSHIDKLEIIQTELDGVCDNVLKIRDNNQSESDSTIGPSLAIKAEEVTGKGKWGKPRKSFISESTSIQESSTDEEQAATLSEETKGTNRPDNLHLEVDSLKHHELNHQEMRISESEVSIDSAVEHTMEHFAETAPESMPSNITEKSKEHVTKGKKRKPRKIVGEEDIAVLKSDQEIEQKPDQHFVDEKPNFTTTSKELIIKDNEEKNVGNTKKEIIVTLASEEVDNGFKSSVVYENVQTTFEVFSQSSVNFDKLEENSSLPVPETETDFKTLVQQSDAVSEIVKSPTEKSVLQDVSNNMTSSDKQDGGMEQKAVLPDIQNIGKSLDSSNNTQGTADLIVNEINETTVHASMRVVPPFFIEEAVEMPKGKRGRPRKHSVGSTSVIKPQEELEIRQETAVSESIQVKELIEQELENIIASSEAKKIAEVAEPIRKQDNYNTTVELLKEAEQTPKSKIPSVQADSIKLSKNTDTDKKEKLRKISSGTDIPAKTSKGEIKGSSEEFGKETRRRKLSENVTSDQEKQTQFFLKQGSIEQHSEEIVSQKAPKNLEAHLPRSKRGRSRKYSIQESSSLVEPPSSLEISQDEVSIQLVDQEKNLIIQETVDVLPNEETVSSTDIPVESSKREIKHFFEEFGEGKGPRKLSEDVTGEQEKQTQFLLKEDIIEQHSEEVVSQKAPKSLEAHLPRSKRGRPRKYSKQENSSLLEPPSPLGISQDETSVLLVDQEKHLTIQETVDVLPIEETVASTDIPLESSKSGIKQYFKEFGEGKGPRELSEDITGEQKNQTQFLLKEDIIDHSEEVVSKKAPNSLPAHLSRSKRGRSRKYSKRENSSLTEPPSPLVVSQDDTSIQLVDQDKNLTIQETVDVLPNEETVLSTNRPSENSKGEINNFSEEFGKGELRRKLSEDVTGEQEKHIQFLLKEDDIEQHSEEIVSQKAPKSLEARSKKERSIQYSQLESSSLVEPPSPLGISQYEAGFQLVDQEKNLTFQDTVDVLPNENILLSDRPSENFEGDVKHFSEEFGKRKRRRKLSEDVTSDEEKEEIIEQQSEEIVSQRALKSLESHLPHSKRGRSRKYSKQESSSLGEPPSLLGISQDEAAIQLVDQEKNLTVQETVDVLPNEETMPSEEKKRPVPPKKNKWPRRSSYTKKDDDKDDNNMLKDYMPETVVSEEVVIEEQIVEVNDSVIETNTIIESECPVDSNEKKTDVIEINTPIKITEVSESSLGDFNDSEIILPPKKSKRANEIKFNFLNDSFTVDSLSSDKKVDSDILSFPTCDDSIMSTSLRNNIEGLIKDIDNFDNSCVSDNNKTIEDDSEKITTLDISKVEEVKSDPILINAFSFTDSREYIKEPADIFKCVPPKKKKIELLNNLLQNDTPRSEEKLGDMIPQPPKKKIQKLFESSQALEKLGKVNDLPQMSPLAKKKSFLFQQEEFVQTEKVADSSQQIDVTAIKEPENSKDLDKATLEIDLLDNASLKNTETPISSLDSKGAESDVDKPSTLPKKRKKRKSSSYGEHSHRKEIRTSIETVEAEDAQEGKNICNLGNELMVSESQDEKPVVEPAKILDATVSVPSTPVEGNLTITDEHKNEMEVKLEEDDFKFCIQTNLTNFATSTAEQLSAIATATLSEIKNEVIVDSSSESVPLTLKEDDQSDQASMMVKEGNVELTGKEEETEASSETILPGVEVSNESEFVPISINPTVMSEKDLADSQVEITTDKVISEKKPTSLGMFSMDFLESGHASKATPLKMKKTEVNSPKMSNTLGTEFTSKAMTKEFDNRALITQPKAYALKSELLDILEGNSNSSTNSSGSEQKFKTSFDNYDKQTVVQGMFDFEEAIPSQIVLSNKVNPETVLMDSPKLLERLSMSTDASKAKSKKVVIQSDIKVSEVIPKGLITKLTKPVGIPKPGQKIIIKTTKSQTVPKATGSKPIILSEQIIRPANALKPTKPSLQPQGIKRQYEDIEDVETAFIIPKIAKKTIEEEIISITPEKPLRTRSSKSSGKAKIIQQTIITPKGEILQPQTPSTTTTTTSVQLQSSQSQPDDTVFDINSMPIVLSDDILTPESIQNMPVVLSEDVIAQAKPVSAKTEEKVLPTLAKKVVPNVVSKQQIIFKTTPPGTTTPISAKHTTKPRILSNTPSSTSKVPKPVTPALLATGTSADGKPTKYVLVPSTVTPAVPQVKTVKPPVVKKQPPIQSKLSNIQPNEPPSQIMGNKIMIVTNQHGQQTRVVLTPQQQKAFMQTQPGSKKAIIKGAIPKALLESAAAGPSGIPQKTTVSSVPQGATPTVSSQGGLLMTVGKSVKTPIHPKKTIQRTASKPQKTILIKNQLGHTVRKIQGTDDADLDRQVAEQLEAIKASARLQQANKSPEIINYTNRHIPVSTNTNRAPIRRSYSKKIDPVKVKPTVSAPPQVQPQKSPEASIPALAPISPQPRIPQVPSQTSPTLPKQASPTKVEPSSPSPLNKAIDTILQQQATVPKSESKALVAPPVGAENKPTDRPLTQLVIQDGLGNQTTITEGQILAIPSETVDGQPQSYMLVTLDELGNITPLNNEALMSLDPSLGLGGDLNNMVLQVDQGQGTVAALKPAEPSVPCAPVVSKMEQNKVEERLQPEPAKISPEPEPAPIEQPKPQEVPLAVEQQIVIGEGVLPGADAGGQQLIVTGDPIATQKFLESLSDGSTDLANILANAEGGSVLIQADGQQILIKTNTGSQPLLGIAESTEGGGNPIFGTHKPNQDILAAALANTDVFQHSDQPIAHPSPVKGSQLSPGSGGGVLYPMHVGNVLETSLTLSSPIMTPLEVPSINSKKIDDEADILNQIPKNVDLPITITDPNISQTVAQQAIGLMELTLPISETTRSTDISSSSYTYTLPSLDEPIGHAQKPFNGSMPLLTEDVTEMESSSSQIGKIRVAKGLQSSESDFSSNFGSLPMLPETTESSREEVVKTNCFEEIGSLPMLTEDVIEDSGSSIGSAKPARSSPKPIERDIVDEGLSTLGGEMCSSLSEPPPDMFDLASITAKEEEISSDISSVPEPEGETLSLHSENSEEIPIQPPIVANLNDLKRPGDEAEEQDEKRQKFD